MSGSNGSAGILPALSPLVRLLFVLRVADRRSAVVPQFRS